MLIKKRKDFVKRVMEIAHVEGFQRADEIAQAVIRLFQASVGEILSERISESVPSDLSEGWNMILKRNNWGNLNSIDKRKDFVKKIMKLARVKDYQRADEIAQVVIKLIQETIGETLTKKVSESVPFDLKVGWDMIDDKRWNELDFRRKDVIVEMLP